MVDGTPKLYSLSYLKPLLDLLLSPKKSDFLPMVSRSINLLEKYLKTCYRIDAGVGSLLPITIHSNISSGQSKTIPDPLSVCLALLI